MITIEEVKKIANLAKLHLNEEESRNFAKQLTDIMDMIDKLNEVNCDNIEPLTSVSDMDQRTTSDEVMHTNTVSDLFANVPGVNRELAKEIKCFVVPKIIE